MSGRPPSRAVRDGGIELQGDLRERVRAYLAEKGHYTQPLPTTRRCEEQ
ncbi:MAG: hypothetical protein ABIP65_10975 [Vicinamibacterales bacterium]